MKINRIKRSYKIFPVDLNPIGDDDILDIHKYFVKKKHDIK